MKEVVTRSISGFVFVLVMVGSILCGQTWFYMAMGIISLLTLSEFYQNFGLRDNGESNKWLHIVKLAIGLMCYMAIAMPLSDLELGFMGCETEMLSLLLLMVFIFMMFVIELFWGKGDMIRESGLNVLGIIYIIIPFALLSYIGNPNDLLWGFDKYLLLAFFCIIWGNDTFAYLVGVSIGRHKMFPRVSPKKSWEGFFGGLVFSMLIGWIFSLFTHYLENYNWIWFSLIVSLSSVLGDLFESLLKRSAGIKDSGNLIPGHGGMLDRFDAMLLASPITALSLFILINIIKHA